jgi:hypothetical protein
VKRRLGDDIELDDDVSRIDVDVVHAELTTAYWSIGRARQTVERLVRDATRVVGLYDGLQQVGFCRAFRTVRSSRGWPTSTCSSPIAAEASVWSWSARPWRTVRTPTSPGT